MWFSVFIGQFTFHLWTVWPFNLKGVVGGSFKSSHGQFLSHPTLSHPKLPGEAIQSSWKAFQPMFQRMLPEWICPKFLFTWMCKIPRSNLVASNNDPRPKSAKTRLKKSSIRVLQFYECSAIISRFLTFAESRSFICTFSGLHYLGFLSLGVFDVCLFA